MAINWDISNPGDADVVSQFPANERVFRTSVRDGFDIEHDQVNGRHKFGIGTTSDRSAITDWVDGSIWFNTDDSRNRLEFFSSGTWQYSQEFSSGTVLVAHMNAAPAGWTRVLLDFEDRTFILTNGNMSAGGAWTISGMVAVNDGHIHGVSGTTAGENQNHNHVISIVTSAKSGGTSQGTSASGGASTPLDDHTHTVVGNTGIESAAHDHDFAVNSGIPNVSHAHTFDGTWRPAYVTAMVILKS